MEPWDPKSAHPFALDRLTDDEWEELTFLLAWGEDLRVERLRAPDGGLDTVLPRPRWPGEAERGWQAKHYPGRDIHWSKCEESLDRAVNLWKVSYVTFTFPRDLTREERVMFSERLERRHKGIVVDYWSGSEIRARLSADEAGERAARRFFGYRDPIEVMERALRAGGELSRGEHAVDREFAIDEYVQGTDPHFQWVIHKAPKGEPKPRRTPGAVMRLLLRKGNLRMFVDAVPRTAASVEHYGPRVKVITDDSPEGEEARSLMRQLLEGGGHLRLREGVKLVLERLPKPFGDLLTEPLSGDITVRMVPTPEPWFARLEVRSTFGSGDVDVDLLPVEPNKEWDSEWRGQHGGLEMAIRARWSVNRNRGETAVALRCCSTGAPTPDRARALKTLVALYGDGTVRLIDRKGLRTTLEQPIRARPLPPDVRELYRLTDALAEIERFSGQPTLPVPEEITLAEIDGLQRVAETLRNGGEMWRLKEAKLTGGSALVSHIGRSGSDVEVRQKAFAQVFGDEIPIGERVVKLPFMRIKEARRLGAEPHDEWEVVMIPVHANEVEVWAEFRPLSDGAGE